MCKKCVKYVPIPMLKSHDEYLPIECYSIIKNNGD